MEERLPLPQRINENCMAKKRDEEMTSRNKAVSEAITQIREKFGDGSIMRLGEARKMQVASIPTGCASLGLALGVGGMPRGRIIEIFGPEASGKTTLAQHVVAEIQKQGGVAAFVDAEHALDVEYAKMLGVEVPLSLLIRADELLE